VAAGSPADEASATTPTATQAAGADAATAISAVAGSAAQDADSPVADEPAATTPTATEAVGADAAEAVSAAAVSAADEPAPVETFAATTIPGQTSAADALESALVTGSDATVVVPVPGAAESDAVQATPAPVAVAVAEPDDLTKIPGIGPKMAMALAVAGITTYRQLADTDVTALRAAVTNAGMRVAPTLPTWPERAKTLTDTTA
jgi:predicted flap endonuclease-1-like 5' DNA nuclease